MLYVGETVRLLWDLPEAKLAKDQEGAVTGIYHNNEGEILGVEVRFYAAGEPQTLRVPLEALEPVVTQFHGSTAVLWGLEKPTQQIVERGMHAMLDHGFEMRQGLNVMTIEYDRSERFWRTGERSADATGAGVVASASSWDGCLVAFSGRQRFHLEFRLRGRRSPCVLLHQRYEAFHEQWSSTPAAMAILRVLLHLYTALEAENCAFPVADRWISDESWDSLLQQPFFPDLFLLPAFKVPEQIPPLYRMQKLHESRAILTALPVKFSPVDDPIQPTERERKLHQLRACKALGEKAYDQMYEVSGSATGLYSDAKEAFYDAIRLANELGLKEESAELAARLDHIKAVFRSQFS
ncbi:MAG TPA: hypothetical protein VHA33_26380 [Candidatus Angelobacter sp.]|nr:hypothetical protein [Candidatus Angelobacter sp.]